MHKEKTSLLKANPHFPFHVSIGAVVINEKQEVLCHYFKYIKLKFFEAKNFYILMRETPEAGENYTDTLKRGLMEEFGAVAKPLGFLGSLISEFTITGTNGRPKKVQKTTLYFLCKIQSLNESKRNKNDLEGQTKLSWQKISKLIEKMEKQPKGLDESKILKRTSKILSQLKYD